MILRNFHTWVNFTMQLTFQGPLLKWLEEVRQIIEHALGFDFSWTVNANMNVFAQDRYSKILSVEKKWHENIPFDSLMSCETFVHQK